MNSLPIDIVNVVWRASALLAAAGLVDALLRRRGSAAARCLVWTLTIGALLVLPIASYALPHWPVRISVARTADASVRHPDANVPAGSIRTIAATRSSPAVAAAPPTSAATAVGAAAAAASDDRVDSAGAAMPIALAGLVVLYAGGVLMLLVRFAREPFVLRRLTRASREVDEAEWRRVFDEAARHARVGRPVRLLQSAGELMPMTYGTWRPTLVLPASADAWTEDRRRAVLLHELAHVARRDCFVQRLASLACALYWPHPGVWWAARRLRTERELACDDLVLAAGAGPREYAGHLLDLARSLGAVPAPAAALGMARARQLEHRLLAVLDAARNRAAPRRSGITVAVTLALALFVPIAALRATLVPGDSPTTTSATATAPAAFAAQEVTGTWDLRPAADPGVVQLTVRAGRSTHGRTVSRAQLEALAGTPIPGNGPVHVPIRREAGTFTVDGVCRNGTCAGTFGFEANAAFGDMLARRGIGRPAPQEQFSLAAADVGTAYLDALTAAGYARPDIQTLVRAAQHGVDLGYMRDMAGLGHRLGTLEPLIRLRDHGVDPEYVRGMAALGFSRLTSDELVRARDHGVDPEYVRGLASLGYTGLTIENLVKLRDHGVDPEYVRGLAALGYTGLTPENLVKLRDHGVDPEYIRGMAALGYKGVPIDGLIRMRDHGVDPEYVRRLQQRGSGRLSVDELIQRRDRGDDGSPDAAAREMAASLRVLWHSVVAHVARVARLRG